MFLDPSRKREGPRRLELDEGAVGRGESNEGQASAIPKPLVLPQGASGPGTVGLRPRAHCVLLFVRLRHEGVTCNESISGSKTLRSARTYIDEGEPGLICIESTEKLVGREASLCYGTYILCYVAL